MCFPIQGQKARKNIHPERKQINICIITNRYNYKHLLRAIIKHATPLFFANARTTTQGRLIPSQHQEKTELRTYINIPSYLLKKRSLRIASESKVTESSSRRPAFSVSCQRSDTPLYLCTSQKPPWKCFHF